MDSQNDLHHISKRRKDLIRKILLMSTSVFFIAAILIFLYPADAKSITGLEQEILDILAPVLLTVGLADLYAALFIFHSRDHV